MADRASAAAAHRIEVWVVDSLARVQPTDPPLPGEDAGRLQAARNEYEAAQIVLRSRTPVRSVTLAPTDLVGPQGRRIAREAVVLYREHYVRVSRSSPKSPLPPGWWPDALIPFTDPRTRQPVPGQRFAAGRFDLAPDWNQPVWVEVYVPPDAPSGAYTGSLDVLVESETVASVPLVLQVWDFTLPRVPSARSYFGAFQRAAEFLGHSRGTPEHARIVGEYEEALLQHRLMPSRPLATQPSVSAEGAVDIQALHPILSNYVDRFGINSWQIPLGVRNLFPDPLGRDRERTKRYLRELYTYLDEHGRGGLAFIYVVDEPSTLLHYRQVREFAALAREAHPGIKLLLTEAPLAERPRWGHLLGTVGIWVILPSRFDETQVAQRLAARDEVWSYVALVQGDARLPHWQLDFPLMNYRIPLWINWRHGLTGILYWETAYWSQTRDPWTDPVTHTTDGFAFNGEGSLFYPGTAVGYGGPVPSIRLKALRDGMEDYEYFRLLADSGDKAEADRLVRRIAPGWSEWTRDPKELLRVREELATHITRLRVRAR